MKHKLQKINYYGEFARIVYHDNSSAGNAFRKRLSQNDEQDQDSFDALAEDERYVLHIRWGSPDYVAIVSGGFAS